MARLSQELEAAFLSPDRVEPVTLADILTLSGERTFGLFFIMLSLPSALPVPAPGYSTPFAIVILILSIQLILGKTTPWLPSRVLKAAVALPRAQAILKNGIPWLRRIEFFTQPRLATVCTSMVGRIVIGSCITLMATSMLIPIPGTNTLPAIGIFVCGFGLLEDDGLISLAGLLVCLLASAVSLSVLYAIYYGGSNLIDWIKDL